MDHAYHLSLDLEMISDIFSRNCVIVYVIQKKRAEGETKKYGLTVMDYYNGHGGT